MLVILSLPLSRPIFHTSLGSVPWETNLYKLHYWAPVPSGFQLRDEGTVGERNGGMYSPSCLFPSLAKEKIQRKGKTGNNTLFRNDHNEKKKKRKERNDHNEILCALKYHYFLKPMV